MITSIMLCVSSNLENLNVANVPDNQNSQEHQKAPLRYAFYLQRFWALNSCSWLEADWF